MLRSFLLSTSFLYVGAQTMHPKCIASNCGGKMLKAMASPKFLQNSACEMGCTKVYDEDKSPEKLQYQNCTTTCAVSYETPAGDAFLACAMNNNCVDFPPIPGHCPYKKEHIQPDASLASLQGEFWQHRGKNALWDCYDCQHIHSMYLNNDTEFCAKTTMPETGPVKAPCWAYTYSYDLYLKQGGTKTFQQTWQLPSDTPKGEPIEIYYNYMGSWHNETWYIFQATDNYTLLGDCSYMMSWIDVGSIVWVRPGHALTDAENAEIKSVYKEKLGFDYDSFCYDKHGPDNCAPHAASEVYPAPPRIFHHAPRGARRPVLTPEQIRDLHAQLSTQVV